MMKKIIIIINQKENLKHGLVFILYLLMTLGMTYKVLPYNGGITYNDASFFWNIKENPLNTIMTWSSNYLGQAQSNNIFLYFSKGGLIWMLKSIIPNNYIVSYLINFIPMLLCAWVYYFIFQKITKNLYFGLAAGLFIMLNRAAINYILFGGMYNFYLANIGFALLIYQGYKIYTRRELTWRDVLIIILISLLLCHPYFMVGYIIFVLLFLIFMKVKKNGIYILQIASIMLGILLVNSYWIINLVIGSLSRNPYNTYTKNNLSNVYEGFVSISTYLQKMSFVQYINTFYENNIFSLGHTILYIILFLIVILTVWKYQNSKYGRLLIFVIVTYFIFFNLSLGPNSKITGGIWRYLWDNYSWFSFFRTFPRFSVILLPILIFGLAIFDIGWNNPRKKFYLIGLMILTIIISLPVFSGNLEGQILATKIPKEYEKINVLTQMDLRDNNILALPSAPYERYLWGANINKQNFIQDYYLKDYLFDKPIIYNRISIELNNNKLFHNVFDDSANLSNLHETLNKMNIGYVLLEKQLIDDKGQTIDYKKYEKYFDNKKFMPIENNRYYQLYKYINNKSSVIMGKDIKYIKINPTQYQINITNLSNPVDLNFLQTYDDNWVILPQGRITKPDKNNKFIRMKDFTYFFKKPLFENNHKLLWDYANQWQIDPDEIKRKVDPKKYKLNPDGIIDINLVIYYKQQEYFILGLILSVVSIIACLALLVFQRGKNEKI